MTGWTIWICVIQKKVTIVIDNAMLYYNCNWGMKLKVFSTRFPWPPSQLNEIWGHGSTSEKIDRSSPITFSQGCPRAPLIIGVINDYMITSTDELWTIIVWRQWGIQDCRVNGKERSDIMNGSSMFHNWWRQIINRNIHIHNRMMYVIEVTSRIKWRIIISRVTWNHLIMSSDQGCMGGKWHMTQK